MGIKRTINEICEKCGARDARLEIHETMGHDVAYVLTGLHNCPERPPGPHQPPVRFRLDEVIWRPSSRHREFCIADVSDFLGDVDHARSEFGAIEHDYRQKLQRLNDRLDRLRIAITTLRRASQDTADLVAMLLLCGEQECRDVDGYPEKLRVIIDGLIKQRRRAESAERELAQMRDKAAFLQSGEVHDDR